MDRNSHELLNLKRLFSNSIGMSVTTLDIVSDGVLCHSGHFSNDIFYK
jgi:hypothetical protein